MPKKYQNIQYDANRSTFLEVGDFDGTTASFKSKEAKVTTQSGLVPMVSADILVNRPQTTTSDCDPCVVNTVNNSFRISFNVAKGDTATLALLQAEALRLLAESVTLNIVHGLVPPASTVFAE